jgi:hypothetical protein
MRIHEQSFDGPFSDVINQWLRNAYGGSFTGISAFAKASGVGLIEESLREYKSRGGKIIFIVGIDLDGTSYDALINLLELSDELYVVYSENIITFHPKMYLLDLPESKNIAIGSNNLTVGGLFNNFEASTILENLDNDAELYQNYCEIRDRFTNISDEVVKKISSKEDIEELLENGYIHTERSLIRKRLSNKNRENPVNQSSSLEPKIFGSKPIRRRTISKVKSKQILPENQEETCPTNDVQEIIVNNGEFAWFETGKMTGGSRNILDLSMRGRIVSGSSVGTVYYEAEDIKLVKGGTIFFGVDPNSHGSTKDITIKYNGMNYSSATIIYTEGNSNWRLQIKGYNSLGERLTQNLKESLINKILVFEKINSDNYTLMILEKEAMTDLVNQSRFYARNGENNSKGRCFGYITSELEV